MASNTTIQIKKSGIPYAIPTDLANGELAINYADGKIYYKNSANAIVEFPNFPSSFGIVDANGTLITADTTNDILSLEAGNNITIVGDAINDKIKISAAANNITVGNSLFSIFTPKSTRNKINFIPGTDIKIRVEDSPNLEAANVIISSIANVTGGTGGAGGAMVTVDNVAPENPLDGDLWWNTDTGRLFIYFSDIDSSQWVETMPPGAQGVQGVQGANGIQGIQGRQGANGIQGTQGVQGVQGFWKFHISNTAPTGTITPGSIWWSTDNGRLFIYYTDEDSSQWVETSVGGEGPQGVQGIQGPSGYFQIPQNSIPSTYTIQLSDAGKHIYNNSSSSIIWTIPSNSSVAFPIGTTLTFVNVGSGVVTISIASDTLYFSPSGATGSRTLAQWGTATAIKLTSTTWIINGFGLS